MLSRLGRLAIQRPRHVLGVTAVVLVTAGLYGAPAIDGLSPAGYEVGGSESTRASEILARDFDTGPPNIVLLATAATNVDAPDAIERGLSLTDALRDMPDVGEVVSYWETGAPQLRSRDGSQALVAARIVTDEDGVYDRVEEVRKVFAGGDGVMAVAVGGSGPVNLEIVEQSERDLVRAELLIIPITTLVMLFVFRGVVAALLPLVVSAVAVVGTAAALRALSELTLVSVFALNLTTALGLGMAVDYSLFLISRWREERAAGAEPDEALQTSVEVAGRSVLFSGLTTAATLAALLLFDYPLLRSLAIAGFAVVLLATVGALVVLPAVMSLLGPRVDKWSVRPTQRVPVENGGWYRLSLRVMRRPWLVIAVTVGFLLLLGSPFLRAEFGIPDDRVLPDSTPSREVADDVRANFDAREFGVAAVVAPNASGDSTEFAAQLSTVRGVSRVESARGVFAGGQFVADQPAPARFTSATGQWFAVIPDVEPVSGAAESMVSELRSLDTPWPVLVGGESARLVDNKAEIESTLPWVVVWIVLVIFALLFWSFRSILIPLKAFLLNLLSLTASFGAVVWVFQDGRLTGLLGYTPTGLTDAQTPVLMFCIAFGLSMDYEVFLLSRIKEEWDATGDPVRSVAVGLQRTGGIITAAAVLMAIVFLSFATGGVTFIQMVGLGLALAIVMDAVVVRALLVPAFMAIAGKWNWWAPRREQPAVATIETEPVDHVELQHQ